MDSETSFDSKSLSPRIRRWAYYLLADVTVKEVHESGLATREELKIRKLQATDNGHTVDLLPAGTLVRAHVAGGKEIFSIGKAPVNARAMKVLRYSMDLYKGDATTADDIFGIGEPKKVGESWALDKKMLLKSLKQSIKSSAMWPRLPDIVGKVTLVGARRIKGLDMLEYKIEARLENIAPKVPGIKMRSGTLIISISGRVPQDLQLRATYHTSMNLVMSLEGELATGASAVKMMLGMVQAQQSTSTLLE